MKRVKVTFYMEASDESHPSGLTNEDHDMLADAVLSVGADDLSTELVEDTTPAHRGGGPKR